ncbi:MAG: hypothetical protein A2W23_00960 [Planctomycetes bacterium RBG_16_43_13]|nr:MAG: hypothetical protein A2W23_00960 [Planctomycetes bacterium RBG_16_43_13]
MSEFIVVLVTCGKKEEAEKIAESLILERLAACVNIVPAVSSIYFWEGRICNEQELLLIIKTTTILYTRLEKRVKDLHSYEVPEIISIPLEQGSAKYLKWIKDTVEQ